MKYYYINEEAAKTAHNMNHFRDYINGETTASYRMYVDSAERIAEERKKKYPEEADRIDYLLDRYARKLAEWYNKSSLCEAMCPSVMISGAANFPVRKKEKQNSRRDTLMQEWEYIQSIVDKIERTGSGAIKSNDEKAIEKLQSKLESLEDLQEAMKGTNAYYRKYNTVDECPYLTQQELELLKQRMAGSWRTSPVPFEPFELQNNGAEIRRVKARIEKIQKVKEAGTTEKGEDEIGIEGLRVVENAEAMRIQLFFDGKPGEETRNILKSNGFKWAPSCGAWQRMLNGNGKYAAKVVIEKIKEKA